MATLVLSSPESTPTRNSFRVADKVRIIRELEDSGGFTHDVARRNGLDPSQVRRWQGQKDELVKRLDQGRNLRRVTGGGGKPLYGKEIDQHLAEGVSFCFLSHALY